MQLYFFDYALSRTSGFILVSEGDRHENKTKSHVKLDTVCAVSYCTLLFLTLQF